MFAPASTSLANMSVHCLNFPHLRRVLCFYRSYLLKQFSNRSKNKSKIDFWQDKLLFHIILYGISAGFPLLLICGTIQILSRNSLLPTFEFSLFIIVGIFALYPSLSISVRRKVMALTIAAFALGQLFIFGNFTIACIYFMAFSIFIALQFRAVPAYGSVFLNFFAMGVFILLNHPATFTDTRNDPGYVIILWLNLTFINLLTVFLVSQTLKSFERKMRKKETLFLSVKEKLRETARLCSVLRESEYHYRSLFIDSPISMLVYDLSTQMILQANIATVVKYGYSEESLKKLKVTELFPVQNVDHDRPPVIYTSSGNAIYVKLRSLDFFVMGRPAKLLVLDDITGFIEKQSSIDMQNLRLREIAFTQSHVVRAPLANILAISNLLKEGDVPADLRDLVEMQERSASDLDNAIKGLIERCNAILIQ